MTTQSIKDLIAQAVELEDQNETQTSGNFSFDPPPAGVTRARFIEYVELGVQKQRPFQGQAKKPTDKVRITFELLNKKNLKEVGEGDEKRTIAERISVTLPKSLHEKAGYKKLYEKMRRGRDDISHMTQMLEEAFLITVVHNIVDEGTKKEVTYANITDADGSYQVNAPVTVDHTDEDAKPVKVKIRAQIAPTKIFVWALPTSETWATLFIEGEYEKEIKGKKETVSKNWLQELILGADNFDGSALEQMLEGADDLPDDPDELEDDEDEIEDDEEELEDEDLDDEDELDVEEELEEEDEEEEVIVKKAKKTVAAKKKKKSAATATKSPTKKKVAPKKKKKAKVTDGDDAMDALGIDI